MLLKSAIQCIGQITTMTKQGIVSGPFDTPPFPEFRANLLFVVERNSKYHLILTLSSPEESSYNDGIYLDSVPDIMMTSPRAIADLLYEFGSVAYLSKLNHMSAFKPVPTQADIVKFQGFHFLSKFFVVTQLVLGRSSSPAKYDLLHEVFLIVATLIS